MHYLQQTKSLKFASLLTISKELELPITEVCEALIRHNLEGDKCKVFIRVVDREIEVDTWAKDSDPRITRAEEEYFLGNELAKPNTETYRGFLQVSLKVLDSIISKGVTQIKKLWENDVYYVSLTHKMSIEAQHLYISLDDKPSFITRITQSDSDLITPELVKIIRSKYCGESSTLLRELTKLEDGNQKLKKDLHYFKDMSKKEKGSTQKLLIAGLVETLLQATQENPDFSFHKANGDINIAEMVRIVGENLELDKDCSGTSNFRNLIPGLWNQYAKKHANPCK